MPRDLRIRCSCGTLQGVARDVSPGAGNHAVCYCDDCQAFAHFLDRAADVLDPHGGTEIFQMSPAQIALTAGTERLACMRLSPRGLCRWYASCCNTPIGNTLATGGIPFVGLIHRCIERPSDEPLLEQSLGPVRRVFTRFATGDAATMPPGSPVLLSLLRFAGFALRWKLRGDHRRSVFFDPRTLTPTVTPRVISLEQREQLRRVVRGQRS
jgi:Family of unknown function (DUF6151)